MRLDLEPYTLLYVKRGSMAMWVRRARGGDIGERGEYDHLTSLDKEKGLAEF